jgi:hypothetical protein
MGISPLNFGVRSKQAPKPKRPDADCHIESSRFGRKYNRYTQKNEENRQTGT